MLWETLIPPASPGGEASVSHHTWKRGLGAEAGRLRSVILGTVSTRVPSHAVPGPRQLLPVETQRLKLVTEGADWERSPAANVNESGETLIWGR